MNKWAYYLTWGAGLVAGLASLLLAFLHIGGWGALAVIPVGTATVGYGLRWGVLLALLVLAVGAAVGMHLRELLVHGLSLSLALLSGWALREQLRTMVRRERRLRNSLALFNRVLDEVVKKTEKDEVLRTLTEMLGEELRAEVSVWVPARRDFHRLDPEGMQTPVGRGPVPSATFLIRVRGEVVAVLEVKREPPLAPSEVEALARFSDAVSHYLSLLAEHTESQLVAEFTRAVASAGGLEEAAAKALSLLARFFEVSGAGLWRWQQGRFYPVAFYGAQGEEARRLKEEGVAPGEGPLWWVYRENRPRFFEDFPKEAEDVSLRIPGVRGLALYPVLGARRARVVLSLRSPRPRIWYEDERRLLAVVARVFGLMLRQYELKARLEALLELEHALPELAEDEFYQRVLEAAVRLVPGAEAGSLLVRGEEGFSYRAAVGYDLASLAKLRYDDADLSIWCGAAWRTGEPRLLSKEGEEIARTSHETAPAEVIDDAGRLPEIKQNLCVPIEYKGEVLAVLNLDTFTDSEAFDEESLEAARAFAVQVGAMVHEAAHRRFLERAALTDPLTGLQNRRAFDLQFAAELARARRQGYPVALVVMDLTRFKQINDRFGHPAGDRALVQVAEALRQVARGSDLLFRWGGDEFAAILPYADRAGAERAALRYAEAISRICFADVCLGVNIGVAAYPEDGEEAEELLRVADDRMYRAKAEGKVLVST